MTDFLSREYEYLRSRSGRDFFLALAPYATAVEARPEVREVLSALKSEMIASLQRFADEQTAFIEEATEVRAELAARAPEVDNSAMEQPDRASHGYTTWDLDSFARFDGLVERDKTLEIGYPLMPEDDYAPGVVSHLLLILRGRLQAAEYGEDVLRLDRKLREDLGDVGRRIGNLGARYEHALRRFRQEARTLPGLAYGRLVSFGSDLNPEPTIVETDEDVHEAFDKAIREFATAKGVVRKIVNGSRLEPAEQGWGDQAEQFLKGELERLHQELTRRLSSGPATIARFMRDEWVVALGSAIVGGVIVALILAFVFGLGDANGRPQTTVTETVTTTTP
jgi:hypothetical protein